MSKNIWISIKSENGEFAGAEAHKTLHGSVLGVISDIDSRMIIDDEEGRRICEEIEERRDYTCEDGTRYIITEACLRK